MSYDTYENSKRQSHSIFLYHFSDGTDGWFYCSGTESNMTLAQGYYVTPNATDNYIDTLKKPIDIIPSEPFEIWFKHSTSSTDGLYSVSDGTTLFATSLVAGTYDLRVFYGNVTAFKTFTNAEFITAGSSNDWNKLVIENDGAGNFDISVYSLRGTQVGSTQVGVIGTLPDYKIKLFVSTINGSITGYKDASIAYMKLCNEEWDFEQYDTDKILGSLGTELTVNGTISSSTFNGDSYTPSNISHGAINQSQNPYDDKLEITCNTGLQLVSDMVGRFQSAKILLNLYKIQNNNPTLYKRIWYGNIVGTEKNDQVTKIIVGTPWDSLNKRVCKRIFSFQCPHVLYSDECGLDANSHKTAGTITGITDGVSIGAAVFNTGTPDTWLGSKIITSDGEERDIIEDPGTGVVLILRPFSDAIVTTTFYVYDKCDHLLTGDCTTFSNTDNFGGDPYMKNNPMEAIIDDSGAILTNPISEN